MNAATRRVARKGRLQKKLGRRQAPAPAVHADPLQEALRGIRRLGDQVADLDDANPSEEVYDLYQAAQAAQAAAKTLKDMATQAFIRWLKHHRRQLTVGDTRYYVGIKRKDTVLDPVALLDHLFTMTAGELEVVASTLSANAFKKAAVRDLIGEDELANFIQTVEVPEIREGKPTGKPAEELVTLNETFVEAAKKRRRKPAASDSSYTTEGASPRIEPKDTNPPAESAD